MHTCAHAYLHYILLYIVQTDVPSIHTLMWIGWDGMGVPLKSSMSIGFSVSHPFWVTDVTGIMLSKG